MPSTCSAYNCSNRSKKTSGISYFRFPLKNKDLTKRWITNMRRDKWHPTQYSYLCSSHFEDRFMYETNEKRRLLANAIPTIFSFPDHLQKPGIRVARERPIIQESVSFELSPSSNQPSARENPGVHADHSYCLPSEKETKWFCDILQQRNEWRKQIKQTARENTRVHADHSYCLASEKETKLNCDTLQERQVNQIKQGIPSKKMSQKKLKPTLHNVSKSQKYQPKVIFHRLPKSVLDNCINTVHESCFVKSELETSEGTSFNTCEILSETIYSEEDRITLNRNAQSPFKQKMLFTVKATNTMNATKGGSTLAKIVKTSNVAQFDTTLQKNRLPTTFQLGPDEVKDLNEIPSTVEDTVIAENILLSTVEDALLGDDPLTSPESSFHLFEMGEINSELVHAIKKENIDTIICSTKSKTHLFEERMDRDTSIDEPSGMSFTASAFEADAFHNNSEHSHSGSDLSLSPNPTPWLTPKIISVLSMAAGDSNERISPSEAGEQRLSKQILGSRSFTEVSPKSLKQSFKSAKQPNVQKYSSLSLTDSNDKEMQTINKMFKSKMKDSVSKLLRVVPHVSRVIGLKECCGQNCIKLQKLVNDLGIDVDLFSKLNIIINDSVQKSENYNENAKYILQLISSYSREKESERSIQ